MDTTNQIMRLDIGGRWTASEMANSIREIEFLYGLRLYLNAVEDAEPYLDKMFHFPPFRDWRKRLGVSYPYPFIMPHGQFLFTPEELQRYTSIYFPKHVLTIRRIDYASPGIKDFLGIGEVLKQVREFVQFVIELYTNREQRNLQNNAQRIENARKFVQLRLESARADAEIDSIENNGLAGLVDHGTQTILRLVEEKKITASVMLEAEKQDNTENAG
jgi:hypothetical protein